MVAWPRSGAGKKVRMCLVCQETQQLPPKASFHPWEWPEKPWSRLHIDHAGPVLGKTLLIVVDAHSKWIDAHIVSSTSANVTIEKLRSTFATHGLPQTILSDNGPALTAVEFQEFLKHNGVEHLRSTPYHPSSYRVTPQTTTGIAPAELLMGRRLRTHLDLLYPTTKEKVQRRQREQKGREGTRRVSFQPGDRVMGRNFSAGVSWLPGTILECEGEVAVKIKLDDGRIWRRHVDHVRNTEVPEEIRVESQPTPSSGTFESNDPLTAPAEQMTTPNNCGTEHTEQETQEQPRVEPPEPVGLRRSTRDRQPPDWYQ